MFCEYCGKEMDDTSTFCPSCGKPINGTAEHTTNAEIKKKKKKHPVQGVVLIVLGVLVFIATINGIRKKPEKTGDSSSGGITNTTTADDSDFTVGDKVELNDTQNN